MGDSTLKKLVALLEISQPSEVRRAALVVAGELGSAESALAAAIERCIDDPDPAIRMPALDAVGKLRLEAVLPRLVQIVEQGNTELDFAARAAGRLGAKGAKAMEKLMAKASPVQRRRIAAALAEGGTASAESAAAHALLDPDPGVVDAAARSLAAELPAMSPAHRKSLADHLITALRETKRDRPPLASEAGMIRVLAALHDERAEPLFWARVDSTHPPLIRATALQALSGFGPPKAARRVQQLLECAAASDFQVAAPALMLLKEAAVQSKQLKPWLALFRAPDVAIRRFAIDKLQDQVGTEVQQGILEQLRHHDRGLREAAIHALASTKPGQTALTAASLDAEQPDEAWTLARAQVPFAGEIPTAARTRLFDQACKYRSSDDRRSDPLFFLLCEIDADWTQKQIVERALALRKKKKYAEAVEFLKLMVRDPACPPGVRFELAATGLKTSPKDLAPEARANDPALIQFSKLLQDPGFDALDRLRKLKWLEPEDLFYLGFDFAERRQREKEFGGQVLELLISRSPRSNLAKDAKRKLSSEGLT